MSLLPISPPAGWQSFVLRDLAEFINGLAFKPTDWGTEGLPIIRIQNLTDFTKPFNYTTREVPEKYLVRSGDILVSWSATLDAFVWRGPTAILNQHIFKVVPNASVCESRFLFHLLKCVIRDMAESEHLHGSTMKHINRGPFLSFPVAVPPLDEQRRIVARIEEMMERSRQAKGALAELPGLIQSLWSSALSQAFQGSLSADVRASGAARESAEELLAMMASQRTAGRRQLNTSRATADKAEPEKLPQLPDGWRWARLEELAADDQNALVDGPFGSSLKTSDYSPTGARVIRLGNIGGGHFLSQDEAYVSISKFESLRRHEALPGDLLIAALAEPVARACQVPPGLGPAIVKADCMRLRPHPLINATYLMHAINEPATHRRIEDLAHGVGRLRINLGELRSSWIPVAPRAEQDAIVEKLARVWRCLEALKTTASEQAVRLAQLERSILEAAFAGDL